MNLIMGLNYFRKKQEQNVLNLILKEEEERIELEIFNEFCNPLMVLQKILYIMFKNENDRFDFFE